MILNTILKMSESLASKVLQYRLTSKETPPGTSIHGEYCKVFFFRSPSYFGDMYFLGITIKKGNLTYCADMENYEIDTFFQNTFQDNPAFLETVQNYGFSYTGDDI